MCALTKRASLRGILSSLLGRTSNLPICLYRLLEPEPCPDDEEEDPWPFFEPEVL